jgi:hypothetical protein
MRTTTGSSGPTPATRTLSRGTPVASLLAVTVLGTHRPEPSFVEPARASA